MLEKYPIENILFLDIETVPQYPSHSELPKDVATLWDQKSAQLTRFDKTSVDLPKKPEEVYDRAGIYAEFGKIICISTGIIRRGVLRLKSFAGDDEITLLRDFCSVLAVSCQKNIHFLCAHNGKEFDFPYLIRRMLILGLEIPQILDLSGKKPWEIPHLDTMELWKFGDYKSYTSLELLSSVFKIPSPKDDIRGEDVGRVYWNEGNLGRIVTYCQKDVVAIVNLLLRFKGKSMVRDSDIEYAD